MLKFFFFFFDIIRRVFIFEIFFKFPRWNFKIFQNNFDSIILKLV